MTMIPLRFLSSFQATTSKRSHPPQSGVTGASLAFSSDPTPQKTPHTTTIGNYQTDRNGRRFRTNKGLQRPHRRIKTGVTLLLINRFRPANQSSQSLRTHATQRSRQLGNDTRIEEHWSKRNPSRFRDSLEVSDFLSPCAGDQSSESNALVSAPRLIPVASLRVAAPNARSTPHLGTSSDQGCPRCDPPQWRRPRDHAPARGGEPDPVRFLVARCPWSSNRRDDLEHTLRFPCKPAGH